MGGGRQLFNKKGMLFTKCTWDVRNWNLFLIFAHRILRIINTLNNI